MSLIALTYECPGCKHIFDDIIKRSERGEGTDCPLCQEHCERDDELMTAPNVARASHPDGRKTDTTRKLVEASRIEAESFNLPDKKRKKHNQEIKKLRGGDLK